MSYKDYEVSILPTRMAQKGKVEYFEESGEMKDEEREAVIDATQARFIDYAPDDALLLIGSNDSIEKPEALTNDQYRDKLKTVWDRWQKSGTPAQLIKEIRDLGFPGKISIIPKYIEIAPGQWRPSLPDLVGNPDTDPMKNFWSVFYVVIGQPHGYTQILWGDWVWGDGTLWGGIKGDQTLLTRIIQLIQQLKPAHTTCRGIVFELGISKQWDDFNWGDGTLYGLPQYALLQLREDWE